MVILHNCGKTEKQVGELLGAGADALHVGNAVDIRVILDQVPADIPVMGNLDPAGLFLSADFTHIRQRSGINKANSCYAASRNVQLPAPARRAHNSIAILRSGGFCAAAPFIAVLLTGGKQPGKSRRQQRYKKEPFKLTTHKSYPGPQFL